MTQAALETSLPHLSTTSPTRIHVSFDSVATPVERDWLAAIGHAGSSVTWDAPRVTAVAATLTRVADPTGASELRASAPPGSVLIVREPGGATDSITPSRYGARLQILGDAAGISATAGGTTARIGAPDSLVFKKLLVEGSASWETKFTIAALAERGWTVDALTHVAPGVDVRQGDPLLPDTSRYAAVIAVDSSAALVARGAVSFVHDGGGLLTLHDAPGIGPRGEDPVLLEGGAHGDVRAFRVGNGRVIRVSYEDLWRQRMSDDDSVPNPVAAHRAWLARAVASVAYAPRIASVRDTVSDPAPLADMVNRLGARSSSLGSISPFRSEVPDSIMFGILIASVLLELASRRLRGAR